MRKISNPSMASLFVILCILVMFIVIYAIFEKGFAAGLFVFLANTTSLYLVYQLLLPVKELGKPDFFQPIIFLLANVLIGVSLRGTWLVFSESEKVETNFTFGMPYSDFLYGTLLINLGIMAFLIGYKIKIRKLSLISNRVYKNDNWRKLNVYLVSGFLLILGTIGIFLFMKDFGVAGLTMENLVQKRFKEIEGATSQSASAYLRWLAAQSTTGFIIFFNYYVSRRLRLFSFAGLLLTLLFIEMLAFPLITNSRVGLIAAFLFAGIIFHYHRGLSFQKVSIAGFIVIIMVSVISTVRGAYGGAKSFGEAISLVNIEAIVDIFIANRNLLGVAKTNHIINAIPEKLEYLYGETFFRWLMAPIPRTMWPDKPFIGLGNEKEILEIFHIPSYLYTGIPPGYVAEWYWNFGIIGVFVGMFLLGFILKRMYASFLPYIAKKNKNAIVLYIYVGYSIGFIMPGTSVSPSIINFLMGIIPLGIALSVINTSKASYRP